MQWKSGHAQKKKLFDYIKEQLERLNLGEGGKEKVKMWVGLNYTPLRHKENPE